MSSRDLHCADLSYRISRPAHYLAKINSVTELLKLPELKLGPFKVGDYKWRLQLKPKGLIHKEKVYMSLYLVIDEPHKLGCDDQVLVKFKFFVFDYSCGLYAIFEERGNHFRTFSRGFTRWGFSNCLSLDGFKDPRGRYRLDDGCEIGAELLVSKPTRTSEMLTIKNPSPIKFTPKIRRFSASESRYQYSEAFPLERRDWKLKVCPQRDKQRKNWLSVHLEAQGISSGKLLFVEAILRVSNIDPGKDKTYPVTGWLNANNCTCGVPRFMPWGDLNGGFIHWNERNEWYELKFAVKIQILTIIKDTVDMPIQ